MLDGCKQAMLVTNRFDAAQRVEIKADEWTLIRGPLWNLRNGNGSPAEGEKPIGETRWQPAGTWRIYRNPEGSWMLTAQSGIPHAIMVRGWATASRYGLEQAVKILDDTALADILTLLSNAMGSSAQFAGATQRQQFADAYIDGRIRKVRGRRAVKILA